MLTLALAVAKVMLCASLALVVWRLLRGPGVEDRILALDTLYITTVALLLVDGISQGNALYYEAALLIALLGFIGTASLAKFLLRGDVIE